MAVLPISTGIGAVSSRREASNSGTGFPPIIIGHSTFYLRFAFRPASNYGIT
jgi:hypothetical protein